MKLRTLGMSTIEVAPLVLGGNVFGWTVDPKRAFEILDAFVDAGLNFIDTADMYSTWVPGNKGGESERILGDWFTRSGKRDRVVLATKVGMEMGPEQKGLKAAYMIRAVEDSLRRLQTEYIDLYQAHIDDEETPLEETLRAFDALESEGKVRLIGASNYKGARLQEALDTSTRLGTIAYSTLQPNYNLHTRKGYETDLAPVVAANNLGVIPYFSLASGFLTGKYPNKEAIKGTSREGMLGDYFDERGMRILAALSSVAQARNVKQASVALAWLMAKPNILGPIASATSTEQLTGLYEALDLELSPEELQALDSASAY